MSNTMNRILTALGIAGFIATIALISIGASAPTPATPSFVIDSVTATPPAPLAPITIPDPVFVGTEYTLIIMTTTVINTESTDPKIVFNFELDHDGVAWPCTATSEEVSRVESPNDTWTFVHKTTVFPYKPPGVPVGGSAQINMDARELGTTDVMSWGEQVEVNNP